MSAILDTAMLPASIRAAICRLDAAAMQVGQEMALLRTPTQETQHAHSLEMLALMLAIAPLLKKSMSAGDHIDLPQ